MKAAPQPEAKAINVETIGHVSRDKGTITDALMKAGQPEPAGRGAVAMYQVRPRATTAGPGLWREVSEREFNDYDESPGYPGYPSRDWERRKLYAFAPPVADAEDLAEEWLVSTARKAGPHGVTDHDESLMKLGFIAGARCLTGADHGR